ncbi:MAG TPA: hypothetical protein VGE62_00140 [Candidatus Paceibacterota bacterium]
MKTIEYEDIPRWYHLFWDRQAEGLFIRVHRFFLEKSEFKNWGPYFKGWDEKPSFLPLFDRCEPRLGQAFFGINDSIALVAQDAEWLTYRIKIPRVCFKSNSICARCLGKGKRDFYGDVCYSCDGKGTDTFLDSMQIDEVCYSLAVFLTALKFPLKDCDVDTPHKQLFTVTSMAKATSHGHSVGGYASPEFLRFLESLSMSYDDWVNLPSAVEVMKMVHCRLFGKVHAFDRFACYTRGGQIILDCPGDACQIHTEPDRRIGCGQGVGITCHNLDSAMQQLMLLAGMGEVTSLYDDWVESGKPLGPAVSKAEP